MIISSNSSIEAAFHKIFEQSIFKLISTFYLFKINFKKSKIFIDFHMKYYFPLDIQQYNKFKKKITFLLKYILETLKLILIYHLNFINKSKLKLLVILQLNIAN